jgi:hypothetical protein
MDAADDDRQPGEDWSLVSLYELVPDAYELDLLEEARRPPVEPADVDWAATFARVHRESVASMGHDAAEPASDPEAPAPSPSQACFLVERLLGGVVVDDDAR